MTVIPFKRPERPGAEPKHARRTLRQFAVAMGLIGLVFFMIPTLWAGAPQNLLAVIHLLVAVVYFMQGPRIAAGIWIAVTLVTLVLTAAPSPVTYALARVAHALDAAIAR